MKIEEIQKLIENINQLNLEEVNIETEALKLRIKKHVPNAVVTPALLQQHPFSVPTAQSHIPATIPAASTTTNISQAEVTNKHVEIKSPMIGTFYRASNPEASPYVSVGNEVKAGQVICIIEAMKLFNEIEAEVSGKITQILVEDASPVEFDQPLFIIEPC